MDRVIVYPGAIPLDTDILSVQRNSMVAFGMLMSALVGSVTVVSGLACTPTDPASLQVIVGQGSIISVQTVDGSDFGSLPADTTDPLVKMGINLTPQTFTLTAPTTSGQSVNYLVEANVQETDTNPVVLDYFDADDPTQPFSGPNNSGDQQNTLRAQTVSLQLKAGAPANTGTQVTPAVDAGWVGVWVVTVNFAQTSITGTSITKYPNAPFLAGLLNSHHGGVPGQAPKINLATEVTGVLPSGNVSSILPINLAGGNTEVIGILPLANQASQLPINLAGGSAVVTGLLPLANQVSQLPINLAGGAAEVIGVLPLANQASQLPINLAGGAGQVVGILPVGNMAFTQSLVGNGWSKDPNLKVIQWGTVTSVTGNGDVFAFPTSFPNGCTAIVCLDDGPGIGDIGAAPINASQFRMYAGFNNGGSPSYRSGIGVWFIAIGF